MDRDGGGFVIFDEFCAWCARRHAPVEAPAPAPEPEPEPEPKPEQELRREFSETSGLSPLMPQLSTMPAELEPEPRPEPQSESAAEPVAKQVDEGSAEVRVADRTSATTATSARSASSPEQLVALDQLHRHVDLCLLPFDRHLPVSRAGGDILVLLHLYMRAAGLLHVSDIAPLRSNHTAHRVVRYLYHLRHTARHGAHPSTTAA